MITNVIISQGNTIVNLIDSGCEHEANTKKVEFNRKINKFTEKKKISMKIAEKLIKIGEYRRANRMKECSTQILFDTCPCCGKKIITGANLCRDKLCPVCNWRLSLKRYSDMVKTIRGLGEKEQDYDFYFFTLTVRNPSPDRLKEELKHMSESWDRFMLRRPIRRILKGWARSVEITYNKKEDSFHPHYHVIFVVNKGERLEKEYLKQCWKESARLNYTPQVDLTEIYPKADTEVQDNICNAVLETYKYTVKSKDVIDMPINSFREFAYAIKSKRMVAFGGIIKQIRADMKISDKDEPEERIEVDKCCGVEMTKAVLRWSFDTQSYNQIECEIGKAV